MRRICGMPLASFPLVLACAILVASCGDDDNSPTQSESPQPNIYELSPPAAELGSPGFSLTVQGSGFVGSSIVRWNGDPLETEFWTNSMLRAVVPPHALTEIDSVIVSVYSPPPGGGTTNHMFWIIAATPMPTINAITPSEFDIIDESFELVITGTGYNQSSRVYWDEHPTSTTYVNDTTLLAYMYTGLYASGGHYEVRVVNVGQVSTKTSDSVLVTARNPEPTISSIIPGSAFRGVDTVVTIAGHGFNASTRVYWNGEERVPIWSSGSMRLQLSSSDLSTVGDNTISVANPEPGGGASEALLYPVILRIDLKTNDLVYDPATNRLYASVTSQQGGEGNSIAVIDPETGSIPSTTYVGSEPGRMVLTDNAQYLYVSLDGAAAVRRVIVATLTPDIQFSLGSDQYSGPYKARDMVALPGHPGTIVVSLTANYGNPGPLAVFDEGVMRGTALNSSAITIIEPSATDSIIYGLNTYSSEHGFRRVAILPEGPVVRKVIPDLLTGYSSEMVYAEGRIYGSGGSVIDPEAGSLIGTFAANGPVRPDPTAGRVYFITPGPYYFYTARIVIMDLDTFTPIEFIDIAMSPEYLKSVLRVGQDGLAYRDADYVYIIRSPKIGR